MYDSNPHTHYCYKPLIEPYTGESNIASVQLLSPVPREGTILIAHDDGGSNFFSVYVKNYLVIFEYTITSSNDTRNLTLSHALDNSNATYQLDVTTTHNSAEVILLENGTNVEIERVVTKSSEELYPPSTIFTAVCLGGSLLEVKSYIGKLQSAFFNYNSLLEERNFDLLSIEGISRSDLIVFADNGIPRSLKFSRFTLSSERIFFQARYPVDESGIVMFVQNGNYSLFIAPLHQSLVAIFNSPIVNGTSTRKIIICSESINDGEWHIFNVSINTTTLDSMTLIVDGNSCGTRNELNFFLSSLANSPLEFGATSSSLHSDGVPITFRGCMTGFELQNSENSEIFRPNLEAVPRVNSLFDITNCYHCVDTSLVCDNNRVCRDRGAMFEQECTCPEGLTGSMCEGNKCNTTPIPIPLIPIFLIPIPLIPIYPLSLYSLSLYPLSLYTPYPYIPYPYTSSPIM